MASLSWRKPHAKPIEFSTRLFQKTAQSKSHISASARSQRHCLPCAPSCLLCGDFPKSFVPISRQSKQIFKGRHCFGLRYYSKCEAIKLQERFNRTQDSQVSSKRPRLESGGVFIALGSNVGDRFGAIEDACRAINADPDMQIVRMSHLYETDPMYVQDQGRFLNGVCEIETMLPPMTLLDRLQAIENKLGRVKVIEKGPRNIDLDIVMYRTDIIHNERLKVPHELMWERAFVLKPLTDVLPEGGELVRRANKALGSLSTSSMYESFHLGGKAETLRPRDPSRPKTLMAIMNTTPDSFSDGGDHELSDFEALRRTLKAHIAAGAGIIDVGGQSSRPNAEDVTATEEISRVLPVIEAVRSLENAENVTISVDTYRASVAEAAVRAGAHIVNDISAGTLDQDMLNTVARLGCTYMMMHMRGTPATMQNAINTTYENGIVLGVRDELQERLAAAHAAGIHPWRIILDPGFGFAKTTAQNLQLLWSLKDLLADPVLGRYPWLIGTSRKGFIGKVTGVQQPKQRIVGTAATVTAAALAGGDIFRVHDVEQMMQAIHMGVAIRRAGLGIT